MPCVIYMHGNAGNKTESEEYLTDVLSMGINLFSFDFSGCGNSQGEWVTLGWKEEHDLASVLKYLSDRGTVSKIALWGRSMGAATSIIYTSKIHDAISCSILDSSFATF